MFDVRCLLLCVVREDAGPLEDGFTIELFGCIATDVGFTLPFFRWEFQQTADCFGERIFGVQGEEAVFE